MKILNKPKWIKIKLPLNYKKNKKFEKYIKKYSLNTICKKSLCPNIYKCFNKNKAAFLILGKICTRRCSFCNIKYGNPCKKINKEEPEKINKIIKKQNIKHIIITSVTRDDLKDEGINQYKKCIKIIRKNFPKITIEILTPDFKRNLKKAIKIFSKYPPDIFNHNIETTKKIFQIIKSNSNYNSSIKLLKKIKKSNNNIKTKTGIMVGLGENTKELIKLFKKLHNIKVDILSIGQYLQPSKKHTKVIKYLSPYEFNKLKKIAHKIGFKYVKSGPLIRSSYYI